MRKNFNQCGTRSALTVALLAAMGLAHAVPASNALPTGENVASGSASFNRSIANRLIVNQGSDKLITDWSSFNVGSDARVSFVQPSSSSIALNRVTSGSPTEISGALNANGQVFIVNPNGIVFGAGSQVRVGGLVATTMDIDNSAFNAKDVFFSDTPTATGHIENHGTIVAAAGAIVLQAPHVNNTGRIQSTTSGVLLVNANTVFIDTLFINSGEVHTTQDSTRLGVISNSGIIQASKLGYFGGEVVLLGDKSQSNSVVTLSGRVQAGNNLTAAAKNITIGNLSTDANTYLYGSSIQVDGVFNLLRSNSTLGLNGAYKLSDGAKINLTGATPQFQTNGETYKVIKTINQLQFVGSNATTLSGKYILLNDIDASATATWNSNAGFKPIGSAVTPFNGVLEGLGHRVSGLRINRPTEDVALFAYTKDALIQNLNLRNVSIRGFSAAGLVYSSVYGDVLNNSVTGNIFARVRTLDGALPGRTSVAAGLVGINSSLVFNNWVNVNVTGVGYAEGSPAIANIAGGLIAVNKNSAAGNTVAGTVTAQYLAGGLIGENSSSVYDNVTSANVIGTSASGYFDALIADDTGDTFYNTSTGTVTIK